MINNYYTLLALARSIDESFSGWTVDTPFTQRRNELVIPMGPAGEEPSNSLIVSCEPSANFLAVKTSVSRAARNSTDIFGTITGGRIRSCGIHPADRIISLSFDNEQTLLFRFFGSRANAFCLDQTHDVVETFLRDRDAERTPEYPFPKESQLSLDDVVAICRKDDPQSSIEKLLRRSYPTLGPILTREFLFRSSVSPDTSVTALPDGTIRSLTRSFGIFLEELVERPSPRIILQDGSPLHFSLLPLHHLAASEEESQTSLSRGILRYLSSQKRQDSFLSQKKEVLRSLDQELEKTSQAEQAVAGAILGEEEIQMLERYGKIIHANLSTLAKGMTSLDVNDPFETNDISRSIPLEPAISPARNAERYFDRAKKARERKQETERKRRDLHRRIDELRTLEKKMEEVVDTEGLRSFIDEHRGALPRAGALTGGIAKEPPRPPFRVYTVSGGFDVWVGKNSANNDLLTTRHTAKNDLWFHARGVGGSHVVLKAGSGKGEIPKQAIHAAAAIAAHYSKMKKARHVAVSMCLGKFVRKPRKAPVGTVTMEREEVLFVDPALPKEK